jgi:carotenoid cleavage dioxygenase-like enzyme
METSEATTLPFHLRAAFAPVSEERSDDELEVSGTLPRDLAGTYVRNGPNPRSGRSPAWFAGDGMLHAVKLEDGRARWHKSRWIAGPYAPNTHVIGYDGRLLALVESRRPVAVSLELATEGVYDFGGALARPMTAHPKRCPLTGELLFFSYGATPPFLTFYRADARGRLVHEAELAVGVPTFMHDFAITPRFAVFYVFPVQVGDFRSPVPLRWVEGMPARICVVPRDGSSADLRFFDVAPATISHAVNAFEDGETVVLDAVRAPRLMQPHSLYRYRLDLQSGLASEGELDPRFLDFPRVSPSVVGARQRYAYLTELLDFTPDGGFTRTRAHRFDFETRRAVTHDFGDGAMPGECVVVPRPASHAEDDAWVLVFVHAADGSRTELAVLDAAHFDAPPVARVHLRGRVPFGLHGDFVPATPAA